MKKGKKVIIVFVLGLCCIYIVNYFVNSSKNLDTLKSTKNHLNFNNSLALMFETEANSGEYIQSNDTIWPTGDYVYNETLSKCEKGSKISYDETTKKVLVEANISDKCYVYFDIKPKVLFADYIKGLYTTNGANNLYLHDSSLANSAEDNSIRYAGSSETTNNFVCFGSNATTCPNDDLYRIIGVFGNQVKLIKYDYATVNQLGTNGDYRGIYNYGRSDYKGHVEESKLAGYAYNYNLESSSASNDWPTSLLNKTNLNTNYINYLNNQNEKWANMIENTKWYIGGYSTPGATAKTFYDAEITKQTSETIKIGLMQMSDYGYATVPSNWSTKLPDYDATKILDNNWIYMGLNEWTITPYSGDSYQVFWMVSSGDFRGAASAHIGYEVRPVMYLKADVTYVSGEGTQSLPFRIN